jgi:hypothetical protein
MDGFSMFFTDTKAVQLSAEDQEFVEEHESTGGGLPYLQALTHPNEDTVDVKESRPWGFYINQEQAESINFTPDTNWQPVTFYTVEGSGFDKAVLEMKPAKRKAYEAEGRAITENKGYISSTLMFHIIYQSDTEVERKDTYQGKPYYKFVGLRFGDDDHNALINDLLGERDTDDNPTHRWSQRYMFILVGADGKPLHDGVVTWRAKGGAGGAFSMEMREVFKDLNDAWGKGKGNSRLRMFPGKNRHAGDMRSLVRLGIQFDLYKSGADRAPYLSPIGRVLPTGDAAETKVREAKRGKDGDRTIKLYPSLLVRGTATQMMVAPTSELGRRINAAIEEYASFPLPNQGKDSEDTAATPTGPIEYKGSGVVDAASVTFQTDGWVNLSLLTDSGPLTLLVEDQELADTLVGSQGQVTVQGVRSPDGTVIVSAVETTAPAPDAVVMQPALTPSF